LPFSSLFQGISPNDPTYTAIPATMDIYQFDIIPSDYSITGSPTGTSDAFSVSYTNWTVTNGVLGDEPTPLAPHLIRVAEGYDDSTNQTPERIVESYTMLGFTTFVDLYLGASHYYDKMYSSTAGKYVLNTALQFNSATYAWLTDFTKRLASAGFTGVVASISMEMMDPPDAWVQKMWNGTLSYSGYTPPTRFMSFCNTDFLAWYKTVIRVIVTIWQAAGLTPMLQHGEPWWWYQPDITGFPPCFYDAATLAAHQAALGFALPVFETSSGVLYSTYKPSLDWLANANWEFTQALRDYFRSICTGKFGVLFYAPSIIGATIPPIISIVNYPKAQWARPALDFFEVEDYDWVIDESPKHAEAYTLALKDLKYSLKETHYFAGYVENAAPLSSSIWQDINRAIMGGFSAGFETIVLWAMTQVRRDGWTAPEIIWSTEVVEESKLLFT